MWRSARALRVPASQKLIESGYVLVNGIPREKRYSVKAGDEVEVIECPPCETDIKPENIPLDILYEDDCLLVVNKPKGMVVHPAAGNPDGTLVNALLYHCAGTLSGIGGAVRPGIVHRIDKDTSGLLLVAKKRCPRMFFYPNSSAHIKWKEFMRLLYQVI